MSDIKSKIERLESKGLRFDFLEEYTENMKKSDIEIYRSTSHVLSYILSIEPNGKVEESDYGDLYDEDLKDIIEICKKAAKKFENIRDISVDKEALEKLLGYQIQKKKFQQNIGLGATLLDNVLSVTIKRAINDQLKRREKAAAENTQPSERLVNEIEKTTPPPTKFRE